MACCATRIFEKQRVCVCVFGWHGMAWNEISNEILGVGWNDRSRVSSELEIRNNDDNDDDENKKI